MAIFACESASALVMTATYTGIVTRGSDYTDLFGVTNRYRGDPSIGDLSGQSYSAVYVYDALLGYPVGDEYSKSRRWPYLGYSNPLISADITINGVTVNILSDSNAVFNQFGPIESDRNFGNYTFYNRQSGNIQGEMRNIFRSSTVPVGLHRNFDGDAESVRDYDSSLRIMEYGNLGVVNKLVFGDLRVEHLNISGELAPIPEPATWALLILGFGFCGVAIRSRKPQAGSRRALDIC